MSDNEKVYIHEFIEVIGHNRARYMHHMTANWCPIAREERNQLCFGVWGTVGSTGRWPEVVNLWELDGWDGLVANFSHELAGPSMQDESLANWWAVAAELRRGGVDRVLVPEPWSPTIDDHMAAGGGRHAVYAHELVSLPPGRVRAYFEALRDIGKPAIEEIGLSVVAAFRVAMRTDTEAVLIWGMPDWPTWGRFEQAWDGSAELTRWRAALDELRADVVRTLLVDAPLSPLRTGRQPQIEDRKPLDEL